MYHRGENIMSAEALVEKVSVNINTSTLSQIDLLVDGGHYSNRSDFINQALRSELQRQQGLLERLIAQQERKNGDEDQWFIGVFGLTKRDIAEMHQKGEHLRIRGYGMLHLPADCDEEQLYAVVDSIEVRGKVSASQAVKNHYGLK